MVYLSVLCAKTVGTVIVDDLLLVGINYDRERKTHDCQIERWTK